MSDMSEKDASSLRAEYWAKYQDFAKVQDQYFPAALVSTEAGLVAVPPEAMAEIDAAKRAADEAYERWIAAEWPAWRPR
jgi:hypothetical protein